MTRTVYLCGPMEHVSAAEAQGWRQTATTLLSNAGIKVFDPCRRLHNFRPEEMKSIFELDLRDIRESDMILANLQDVEKIPRHGSAMEIFYAAYVCNVPVVAFKDNKQHIHPFFESLVTEWRSTVDKACDTLISKYL
jgi:nucleoside 2-deoxyribosyltransferase